MVLTRRGRCGFGFSARGFRLFAQVGMVALVTLVALASCAGRAAREVRDSRRAPDAPSVPAPDEHPEARADARGVDVLHYALELSLAPEARALAGTARITFQARRPLERVRFDLVDLDVTAARAASGSALAFAQDRATVEVVLAAPLAAGQRTSIELDYGGAPTRGLWFVGEPVDHCFTQGECEDSRYWFPCIDHPSDRATSELTVDLPRSWSAVSGGERIEARDSATRRSERWRMTVPHPAYLTTLVAGELARVTDTVDGLPLEYLAAPSERTAVGPGRPLASTGRLLNENLGVTPRVITFLEELTARPFPYAKYSTACVGDFPFGGMENASATTITQAALRTTAGRRDADAERLLVHEASHQWFGDLMTCAEWPEIWLNEGFATYCALLWVEARDGRELFELALGDASERYLAGDEREPRAIVHRAYRAPMDLFFTGHVYQGGATRLHLLRALLGDDVFRAGLRRYVGREQHRAVTTGDLQDSLEEVSGVDLDAFFADWVYAPGHPVLEIAARYDAARGRALVRVDQVQALEGGAPPVFRGPAALSLEVAGEVIEQRVVLSERRHLFEIPAREAPAWVVFDPRGDWPARVRHERGPKELSAVATRHPSGVARREAVRALGARAVRDEDGAAALMACLTSDPLEPVRVAAATALRGPWANEGHGALLTRVAADARETPRVRSAAFESLTARALERGHGAGAGELGLAAQEIDAPALGAQATDAPALGAMARRVLGDQDASWALRGAAARLVIAADPVHGLTDVVAALEAARPDADDPHGALAAELTGALAVAFETLASVDPKSGDARTLAREPLHEAAFTAAARSALDEARPAAEREAATTVLGAATAASTGVATRARAVLGELLETRLARLRKRAVEALAERPDPAARQMLSAHYRRATDARERRTIEGALGL